TARIVAATNRDLREMVREGRFRADLYYRLYVMPISVPPLRERREDVPLLAAHFLEGCAARFGKRFEGFEPRSLERMLRYDWPGNVRELKHAVERAAVMADGPLLRLEELEEEAPISNTRHEAPTTDGLVDATLDAVQRQHILRTLESTGFRIAGPNGAA